jgi:hypothetical protein
MKTVTSEFKICEHCGGAYSRKSYENSPTWTRRRFCSHACFSRWHTGENHKAFKPEGSRRSDGYIRVARDGKRVYLHRERAGAKLDEQVHHLDGNPSNNNPANLILTRQGSHMTDYHADLLRKLAKAQRGVPLSSEHRRRISDGLTGKKFSKEHCQNIRKALVEYHRRKHL